METDQIFKNLHDALNNHQREMAAFAHELREVWLESFIVKNTLPFGFSSNLSLFLQYMFLVTYLFSLW